MKKRNVAILMIFWLFCQQAGAAAIPLSMVIPSQNERESIVQTNIPCHDDNRAEKINSDNAHLTRSHHYNSTIDDLTSSPVSSQHCCDLSCQCSISSCQSMLGSQSNQPIFALPLPPEVDYFSVVPQTPTSLLFRPPIIA